MTLKQIWSLIIATGIPIGSPFCFSNNPRYRRNSRIYSDTLRDELTDKATDSGAVTNSKIEVWLDLRGTSITPKMALELWQTEMQDMQHDILFTQVPFTKCLVSYDERDSSKLSRNVFVEVMMVDENGDSFGSTSLEHSAISGKIVKLEASSTHFMPVLPDPLPLMDQYSQGGWILLDTCAWRKIDETEKFGSLFPLVELITSMEQGSNGKTGWTCYTKSEVTKSAMWIQCQDMKGTLEMSTKTLDSGIIIPGNLDDTASSSSNNVDTKYVIIVPYDVGLLKTAMSFMMDNDTDG
jgi:hypothetical protein